ncbi:MAG: tRNA (adenosine(37)-N6)-threonylcarbamoyltransferase complex transferase subunit TsaD [Bacteroidia bacterium]|nr:tRNA (adenosine(37)-N6)-threonylcarbamoyltransferase complex transferase subunit TsaD [Bacteroidia bacterium]
MQTTNVITLAIESSCDDTSCAVLINNRVLSNVVTNQEIHNLYGGVVPELASRAHQQNIVPAVDAALKKANMSLHDVTYVAYTNGPGLMGSLLVGASFAKGLALALNKPLVEVNHMQGHYMAHFIATESSTSIPPFPFLCLTVSGGHTQILLIKNHFEVIILGETLDDAAGEAFDKVAKTLQLPYPGGPLVDKYAQQGNPKAHIFAKPKVDGHNFSFSGFKTSVLNYINKQKQTDADFVTNNMADICASAQHTIISMLMKNVLACANEYNIKHIALAGGVAANSQLRKEITALQQHGYTTYIPAFEYCTDNAAMIGITAYYKYLNNDLGTQQACPQPRMAL